MKDQAQCYEEKVETKSHCAQTKVYTTITTNDSVDERAIAQKGEDDRRNCSSSVDLSKLPLSGGR
jgi:hypothetical protein